MGFIKIKFNKHSHLGFSLLELIVFIVVSAILIVTMFASFTRISRQADVNVNNVVLITQNAAQYFENWIMSLKTKCTTPGFCPSSVTNFLTSGFTITCDNTSTHLLCSTKLNSEFTYSITATISSPTGTTINVSSANPLLLDLPVWQFTVTTNVLKEGTNLFSYSTTKMVPK
jgi:Tfp pilus assembly protein PilE